MSAQAAVRFFTPISLADHLALSERTVRELLAARNGRPPTIPSYKVGGARRIHPVDVESYLESCKCKG